MASPNELRQNVSERPAQAGRLAVLGSVSPLHLALAFVLAAAVALAVFESAASHSSRSSARPTPAAAPSHLISAEQPSSPVVFKSLLSLAPENGRRGDWKRFADGVSRPKPFGVESIAFGPTPLLEFETVGDQLDRKVWRWRLATSRLKFTSTSNGFPFSAGGAPAGFRILVTGPEIAHA